MVIILFFSLFVFLQSVLLMHLLQSLLMHTLTLTGNDISDGTKPSVAPKVTLECAFLALFPFFDPPLPTFGHPPLEESNVNVSPTLTLNHNYKSQP